MGLRRTGRGVGRRTKLTDSDAESTDSFQTRQDGPVQLPEPERLAERESPANLKRSLWQSYLILTESNLESHIYIHLFSRSQTRTRTPFYLKPFWWSFRLPSSVMSKPNSCHCYVWWLWSLSRFRSSLGCNWLTYLPATLHLIKPSVLSICFFLPLHRIAIAFQTATARKNSSFYSVTSFSS